MPQPRQQIGIGPLAAALGAAILLISTFLDWFEPGLTAWTAFEVLDVVLAGIAVVALLAVAAVLVPGLVAWKPRTPLWLLGAAAVLLVVLQLLNHPPAAQQSDLEIGAWLGLAGSLLILVGGLLGLANLTLAVTTDPPAPPPTPPTAPTAVAAESPDGPADPSR